jgi:hypothetical protein
VSNLLLAFNAGWGMQEGKPKIRLSPVLRLNMSFARELEQEGAAAVYDEKALAKFKEMYEEAVRRRDNLLRTMVIADAGILLLLYGRDVRIPGFGISLLELPAGLELASLLASVAFMFACLAFFNEQAYIGLLNELTRRKTAPADLDPDFLAASEMFTEFFLKAYRPKFNIWGPDHYVPGNSYTRLFGSLMVMILAALFVLIALHFVAVGASLTQMLQSSARPLISMIVVGFDVWLHLCGLLVVATMTSTPLAFTIGDGASSPGPHDTGRPDGLLSEKQS